MSREIHNNRTNKETAKIIWIESTEHMLRCQKERKKTFRCILFHPGFKLPWESDKEIHWLYNTTLPKSSSEFLPEQYSKLNAIPILLWKVHYSLRTTMRSLRALTHLETYLYLQVHD